MGRKKTLPVGKRQRGHEVVSVDMAQEAVTNLVNERGGSKQSKFFLYHEVFNFPLKDAARMSGYQVSYAYKLVEKFKKKPKYAERVSAILDTFPDRYRLACKAKLPWLAELEARAFAEYEKDPKLLVDKPQLAKHVRAGAGVHVDEPSGQTFVNVEELKLAIGAAVPDLAPRPAVKVIDAKVVDEKD